MGRRISIWVLQKPDRTRVAEFGDDLSGKVWFDWNAVCGTPLGGTPWFWAVLFQGEIIADGNESGELKARAAAVEFVRALRASPQ
jgi:hypothetical protein